MREKIFRRFFPRTLWCFAVAAVSIAAPVPFEAIANEASPLGSEQKQSEQEPCKFLMENVNAIILSLDPEGKITFVNPYGKEFFGYSAKEIIGKPMLGTLTPARGFEDRDLNSFPDGLKRDPNRYAFSVNQNIPRNGQRVWIF